MTSHPVVFTKGHGTENDFVLLDDPDGELVIEPGFVATLSDRRAGLGADGLIRVIRSKALAEIADTDAATAQAARLAVSAGAEWFMDYLNADGSPAEMCGNGIRVLAAHLVRRGWIDLTPGSVVPIGTRGGVKALRADGDLIATGMGGWRLEGGAQAVDSGGDVTVQVSLASGVALPALPGISVYTGNPHVVVLLPDAETLQALDLTVPPTVEPVPARGANVEFVVPTGEQVDGGRTIGHAAMRVHERGVGETRSCGTGAVAVALAVRALADRALADRAVSGTAPDEWQLDVPGGRLRVRVPAGSSAVEGSAVELAGPAELVAEGQLLLPLSGS